MSSAPSENQSNKGGARASSLSKLKELQAKNNMQPISKEQEEQIAKEKKNKLDEIKKKYSQMSKKRLGGSHSRRRIASAKMEAQSAITAEVSQITEATNDGPG